MKPRIIEVASELNKLSGRFAEMAKVGEMIINGKKTILVRPEGLIDIAEVLSSWADVLLEEMNDE